VVLPSLLVVLAATLLTGCSASGPIYVDAPPPKDGDALVTIYRNKSSAMQMQDAHFYVDDTHIADLSQGGYTWFHIRSGSYVLKQKWGALTLMRDLELNVKWLPGHTHYYRLEISHEFDGNASSRLCGNCAGTPSKRRRSLQRGRLGDARVSGALIGRSRWQSGPRVGS